MLVLCLLSYSQCECLCDQTLGGLAKIKFLLVWKNACAITLEFGVGTWGVCCILRSMCMEGDTVEDFALFEVA